MKSPYANEGRLQNVLALIQVLAFSPKARRTEIGVMGALKRAPQSGASSWIELAKEHPEFFSVREVDGASVHVSLIARNAQQSIEDGVGDEIKPLLTNEVANKLMELAVQLHDKEAQRRDFWKTVVIPLVVGVVAATAAVTSAAITALYRHQ